MPTAAPQHIEIHPGLCPEDTLFLHGNLSSNLWWKPLRRELSAGQKGRAILMEWTGCGKAPSPKSREDLNLDALAEFCLAEIKNLNLKTPTIVGHSTGSLIALRLALKIPVSRLILLAPVHPFAARFSPLHKESIAKLRLDSNLLRARMSAIVDGVDGNSEWGRALAESMMNAHPLVWSQIPESIEAGDLKHELNKITPPTDLVLGERDPFINKQELETWVSLLPNAKLIYLANCGHSPQIEDPKQIALIIKN